MVRRRHHRQFLDRHDLAFAADIDMHALGLARFIQQPHQQRLLLEQVKGTTQLRHVGGKIADRQQVAFAGNHHVLLRSRLHGLGAGLDRRLHQAGNFATQTFDFGLEARPDLLHRHAAVMRVQVVGSLDQLALVKVGFGEQHAVLHIAIGRDDDHQDAFFGQAQEFNMAEHRAATRAHHHANELRQAGQHVGRAGNHFLGLFGRQRQLRRNILQLAWLHRQHGVHEQAQATAGGNTPGRGMRAGDQAQAFQVSHDVADGGGRQLQPRGLRQGAGTNRLTVCQVAVDQGFEEQFRAFIQHGMSF